jgi:argininosuccinate lyase
VDVLPLGGGALAGTTLDTDRDLLRSELGFAAIAENSLDIASDRDFCLEFVFVLQVIALHLAGWADEWILWSTTEFAFLNLPDAVCTGSSIMPQKKNPDVPELVRGKTGRVYGNLMSLLTVMKALPLAYNKDMQEDKEPLFDTIDTVKGSLKVFADMIAGMSLRADNMREAAARGFSTATDVADYVVRKGIPFREAHEIVGKTVRYCIEHDKRIEQLSLEELRRFSPAIEADIFDFITLEASVNARRATGGTARKAVRREIAQARQQRLKRT